MKRDMNLLSRLVDGFVLGCLDVDANVDVEACKTLLENSGGLPGSLNQLDCLQALSFLCNLVQYKSPEFCKICTEVSCSNSARELHR